MFCNMFSESSTDSWAELQLPCSLSNEGELPKNMFQYLLPNLPPQTVSVCRLFPIPIKGLFLSFLSYPLCLHCTGLKFEGKARSRLGTLFLDDATVEMSAVGREESVCRL